MKNDLILLGGGGHCRSVIDVVESAGFNIMGILDRPEMVGQRVLNYSIIGTDDDISLYVDKAMFLITVGQIKSNATRIRLANLVNESGGRFATVIIIRTDKNAEPDMNYIKEKVTKVLEAHPDYQIYLTQGFICRNAYGEIDNLLRGGSDYTACLVGAAVQAEEIQIWTDIDGMHNNDPRFVEHTEPVRQLYFEEAAELAYFGAKILHPTCIQPAKFARVPVRLLNTMDPKAPGTIINNDFQRGTIKAVAARDNNICIQINSSRMLLAYGFLRKVFEIFETYKTSIDMICTSEVGVSVTIDNRNHLTDIVNELKKYGTVSVEEDMCIICVV